MTRVGAVAGSFKFGGSGAGVAENSIDFEIQPEFDLFGADVSFEGAAPSGAPFGCSLISLSDSMLLEVHRVLSASMGFLRQPPQWKGMLCSHLGVGRPATIPLI